MKDIYYMTSTGERIDLIGSPYRMLTETQLFDYEWEAITQGITQERIVKMKKGMVSPPFSIRVLGNGEQDCLNKVEALISAFDGDVFRGEMGRLYVGDYYRDCFVKSSAMAKVWKKSSTVIEFTAISDNANWQNDKTYTFSGASQNYTGNIASNSVITASRELDKLIVDYNDDNSISIAYQVTPSNLSAEGELVFEFPEALNITHIGGIYFKQLSPISINLYMMVSTNGTDWQQKATIQLTYGQTYEFVSDMSITAKYVKFECRSSSVGGGWTVSGDAVKFNTILNPPKDELFDSSAITLEGAVLRTAGLYYVEGEVGYIYLNKDINYITDIESSFLGSVGDVRVEYLNDSNVWTDIGARVSQGEIDWSGNQYVNGKNARIKLPNGSTYFQGLSIEGYERKQIINESYAPTDMKIKIQGVMGQAIIIIGNNNYGADVELTSSQWLEVDTKNHTVRRYSAEGDYENVYNERVEDTFSKLPAGKNQIIWEGLIDNIEIKVANERSQPKWN